MARRADGNREFARLLELCLTHSGRGGRGRLSHRHARKGGWSADSVRQVLDLASTQDVRYSPLDPAQYPAYQAMMPSSRL